MKRLTVVTCMQSASAISRAQGLWYAAPGKTTRLDPHSELLLCFCTASWDRATPSRVRSWWSQFLRWKYAQAPGMPLSKETAKEAGGRMPNKMWTKQRVVWDEEWREHWGIRGETEAALYRAPWTLLVGGRKSTRVLSWFSHPPGSGGHN